MDENKNALTEDELAEVTGGGLPGGFTTSYCYHKDSYHQDSFVAKSGYVLTEANCAHVCAWCAHYIRPEGPCDLD